MEKNIKQLSQILLLIFLFVSGAEAQFLSTQEIKFNTFQNFEKSFKIWRDQNNIDKIKGWKWLARWEAENAKNLDGNGNLPDQNIFFQEALSIENEKNKSAYSSNESWIPVGPYSIDNTFGQGEKMGRVNTIAFHPTKLNTIFIGVAQGGIWESSDDGQTWIERNNGLPILRISDIAIDPNNPTTMYVCLGDYAYIGVSLKTADRKRNTHYGLGIYKSTDGGNSWKPTGMLSTQTNLDNTLFRRLFVNPKNSKELCAVGVSGIFKSYDAGNTWTKKNNNLIWDIEMDHFNSNILFASSGYVERLNIGKAGLMRSTNFGETWEEIKTKIPPRDTSERIEIASSPVDSNLVFAVVSNVDFGFHSFYKSTNRGKSYTLVMADSGNNNILGYNLFLPGGQASYDLGIIADAKVANTVYIAGIYPFSSIDGGKTWNEEGSTLDGFVHSDQHYYGYNPKSKKYYLCGDGGVYMTTDLKGEYEFITFGLNITSYYRLGLGKDNPPTIIAGAQDNGTVLLSKTDESAISIFGGDGMDCLVSRDDTSTFFVSYQYGNFYRININTFETTYMFINNNAPGEWTTPIIQSANNPNKLLTGFGDVYQTLDKGDSWQKISNFTPIPLYGDPSPASAIAIAPSNENVIYCAKRIYHSFDQPAELYVTKDGGTSWTNITKGLPDSMYFTSIAVSNTNPNLVYITCAGFADGIKIFKTKDAGKTWINISYDLPNIPVNSVVHQAGSKTNLVYIGTDLGVYFITDSLNSWKRYSNNLPNVIVDEIEIHQGSKKLYVATFGRGIWMSDLVDETKIGVQDFNAETEMTFSVYPNPNQGNFELNFNNNLESDLLLEIIDIQGKKVFEKKLNNLNKNIRVSVNANLSNGIYFAKITGKGYGMKVKKFQVGV